MQLVRNITHDYCEKLTEKLVEKKYKLIDQAGSTAIFESTPHTFEQFQKDVRAEISDLSKQLSDGVTDGTAIRMDFRLEMIDDDFVLNLLKEKEISVQDMEFLEESTETKVPDFNLYNFICHSLALMDIGNNNKPKLILWTKWESTDGRVQTIEIQKMEVLDNWSVEVRTKKIVSTEKLEAYILTLCDKGLITKVLMENNLGNLVALYE